MSDLERLIRQRKTVAVNIHFDGDFRVHVRDSQEVGFSCAQMGHGTIADALAEHFKEKSKLDLSDLL